MMYDKLPMLMGQIELKGYVPNPGISFAAIGDATVDSARPAGEPVRGRQPDQGPRPESGSRRAAAAGRILRALRLFLLHPPLRAPGQGRWQEGLFLLRR